MTSHGQPWPAMASHGRPWPAMAGYVCVPAFGFGPNFSWPNFLASSIKILKAGGATKGKSAADKIYDKIEDKLQDKLQEWFQGSGHHQVEALKLTFIMYERTEGN